VSLHFDNAPLSKSSSGWGAWRRSTSSSTPRASMTKGDLSNTNVSIKRRRHPSGRAPGGGAGGGGGGEGGLNLILDTLRCDIRQKTATCSITPAESAGELRRVLLGVRSGCSDPRLRIRSRGAKGMSEQRALTWVCIPRTRGLNIWSSDELELRLGAAPASVPVQGPSVQASDDREGSPQGQQPGALGRVSGVDRSDGPRHHGGGTQADFNSL